jgi:hypothetical protein
MLVCQQHTDPFYGFGGPPQACQCSECRTKLRCCQHGSLFTAAQDWRVLLILIAQRAIIYPLEACINNTQMPGAGYHCSQRPIELGHRRHSASCAKEYSISALAGDRTRQAVSTNNGQKRVLVSTAKRDSPHAFRAQASENNDGFRKSRQSDAADISSPQGFFM